MLKWIGLRMLVKDLKPYEKNPRKITDAAYTHLLDSLRQDGYHQRILATTDGRVIGGHQRIKALKELGIDEIEVLVPDREIPEEQFKRILVRDNLGFGEWDLPKLGELMSVGELKELGMPSDLFPRDKKGLTEDDASPAAPTIPRSASGDVWLLGEHRVMCGSSGSIG